MKDDSAAPPSRVSPRKRNQSISVADITMLVRVPGKPTAIRAFTDDERELAAEYAGKVVFVTVDVDLEQLIPRGPGG